jgi:hypothetical protein
VQHFDHLLHWRTSFWSLQWRDELDLYRIQAHDENKQSLILETACFQVLHDHQS